MAKGLLISQDVLISNTHAVWHVQVRVGGYRLPKDLGIGQFRELKPHEVRRVTDKAAQADPYL